MSLMDLILERLPGSWQMPRGTALAFGAWDTDLGAFPTCNASRRGELRYNVGDVGDLEADNLWMCSKHNDDTYGWDIIAPPSEFFPSEFSAAFPSALASAFPAALATNLRVYTMTGTAATASNASTSTYQTFQTMSKLLPIGTWQVSLSATGSFHNETTYGSATYRLSSPFTGTAVDGQQPSVPPEYVSISLAETGSVVSDGVANTVFTTQYRAYTTGTAVADDGSLIAVCLRTSAPATTTTLPPSTTTTAAPGSYLARIYDYTDNYSPYAEELAGYYAAFLAPAGVNVEYHRMATLDFATCSSTTPPERGVRLCEEPADSGFLGSSNGAWWERVDGVWELFSEDYFWSGHGATSVNTCTLCTPTSTCTQGEYVLCHELGHSFGLAHEDAVAGDYSCGYPSDGYTPGTLSAHHKDLIISRLPSLAAFARMGISPPEPETSVCPYPETLE